MVLRIGKYLGRLAAWFACHWILRICLIAGLFVVVILAVFRPVPQLRPSLPDFKAIRDIPERKAAFFSFLEPYIEKANRDILGQRKRLLAIERRLSHSPMNYRERRWFEETAKDFGLDFVPDGPISLTEIEALRLRLDIIPPSLALAQAALETGWGTSRFAREGNNLFGIWCYEPGCGLVPRKRPAGATYEVKKYLTPKDSFADYIRNLNSNTAYQALWDLRAESRDVGDPVLGADLAQGLYRYSEEGWQYISKIRGVIQSNRLERFDLE